MEYKIAWLRGPILEHRRSPVLLEAAEKWLNGGTLNHELNVALADALFDYKPDEWYPGGEGIPRPPQEKSTSPKAAVVLDRIGKSVLEGKYPAATKSAVRRTLRNLP